MLSIILASSFVFPRRPTQQTILAARAEKAFALCWCITPTTPCKACHTLMPFVSWVLDPYPIVVICWTSTNTASSNDRCWSRTSVIIPCTHHTSIISGLHEIISSLSRMSKPSIINPLRHIVPHLCLGPFLVVFCLSFSTAEYICSLFANR